MAQTRKAPEARRREIIEASIELFATKGYSATSVNDILDAVGIAKGTFYHHFASKEEVMREVVLQIVEHGVSRAEEIADDESTPAPERVMAILAAQRLDHDQAGLVKTLHEAGNAEFHLLSQVATINRLTPVLARVIRQGTTDGDFDVAYPEETVSIFLTAAYFLTDEGFEGYTPNIERLMPALLIAAQRLFGAGAGTFLNLAHILEGG